MKGNDKIVFALRHDCKEWVQLDSEGRLKIVYHGECLVVDKKDVVLLLRRLNELHKKYGKKHKEV